MASFRILVLLAFLFNLACAHSSHLHKRGSSSEPLPPSRDPWYVAPAGYESALPGTVLRLRPAPGNLTLVTGNSSAAYNILYRTTDSHYKPTWAVTTLFVPYLGDNSTAVQIFNETALLSYQIPYDSADVDASPSYALYNPGPLSPIGILLGFGMFVSVPDYEGPLASFTAGVISGHATLDSVRAVLSLGLGLDTSSSLAALWGYSGGALASEWATELAVQYAPDLTDILVGAALGGLTPNVTSVLASISGKLSAGLAPSSILGLTSQYPEVQEFLLSQLKTSGPYNRTGFLAARNYTLEESGEAFAGQDIGKYFTKGLEVFQDPKVLTIIQRDGIMGYHGVPGMPIFAYKAINDEISRISDTDELINRYCGIGANILYQRNTFGSHSEEAENSGLMAVEWLVSVLAGSYASLYKAQGCTVENVTRQMDSAASKIRKRSMGIYELW
ncbi:Fc.00g056000.m01.CDS01 [Cosmosporella sp. VM-42]